MEESEGEREKRRGGISIITKIANSSANSSTNYIKYAGWFMCSKIGEFERYCAISRELLNAQAPNKYQEPVDSADANIVENTALKKRQISPSDYWSNWTGPCSAAPLSVQSSYRYKNVLHQVPHASATVWQYHRMFTQFSLCVWVSEYICRPIIVNLLYVVTVNCNVSLYYHVT